MFVGSRAGVEDEVSGMTDSLLHLPVVFSGFTRGAESRLELRPQQSLILILGSRPAVAVSLLCHATRSERPMVMTETTAVD